MSEVDEDVLAAVGTRLRGLRLARRVTLAELADQTGISASTLSRLENGLRRPTLEQMLPLARAHGVPLDELVGAPRTGDPRVHLRPLAHQGMTFVPLSHHAGALQAFKVVYPPASQWGEPTPRRHEGYQWFYVMTGRVRLLCGDQQWLVRAGEVAELDTDLPHWIGSADEQPAELLTLVGPQGQRAHVRVSSTRRPQP